MPITIGSNTLVSGSNTGTGTFATFQFLIYPNTTSGATRRIVAFNPPNPAPGGDNVIYVANDKLTIRNGAYVLFLSYTDGEWTVPISATTEQLVVVRHEFGNDASDPTVWINGVSQTVTETSTPVFSVAWNAGPLYVGGNAGDGQLFDGRISELAFWPQALVDEYCQMLSVANVRGLSRQANPNSPEGYWPLNDIVDGVAAGSATYLDRAGSNNLTSTSGTGAADSFMSY